MAFVQMTEKQKKAQADFIALKKAETKAWKEWHAVGKEIEVVAKGLGTVDTGAAFHKTIMELGTKQRKLFKTFLDANEASIVAFKALIKAAGK